MATIGSASLAILPSFSGFQNNLERGVSGPLGAAGRSGGAVYGDSAGKAAAGRFRTTFTRAAKATLIGVAGLGVGAFKLAGDSVKLASDLNESLNAVNVSYGKQGKAVQRLGRQAADSLGLSNEEFNSLSVRFSAFSKTIAGGEGKKVVTTLDDLTTRASDFASVMNLEVNEAAELFQSGLAGETEPLRKYGLDLSAAAVEAYALSEGIVKNKGDLTEAAKVQARYGLLMEKTSKTQGDFANTSDSLANRQRILSARWDDARATLGTALLPMLEDLSGWVLDKGIPAFEDFAEWFQGPGIKKIQGFGRFLRDDLAPPLKSAADFAGDLVGWLDKLPKNVKIGGLAGLAALTVGAKLRGGNLGSGGALGTVGKVLGIAKPVPVFVTNPGFGAGGVPGKGVPPVVTSTPTKTGKPASLLKKGLKAVPFVGATLLAGEVIGEDYDKFVGDGGGALGLGGGIKEMAERARGVESFANAWKQVETMVDRAHPKINTAQQQVKLFGDAVSGLPPEKTVTVRTSGVNEARALLAGLGRDLDWVSRPREARITITRRYSDAGFQTPGLQERAGGGHMKAGTPYLVGERGPEVFTPYAAGRMTANHQAAPGSGGSGVTIHIGQVVAHDYHDFMSQVDRRAHRAALEGRR